MDVWSFCAICLLGDQARNKFLPHWFTNIPSKTVCLVKKMTPGSWSIF